MYICVRNIDVISVPCCVVMYMCVRNIDIVSVPCCVVMDMCVRNIDVVSVPCEWSCLCLSGISMLSLFLVAWSCICVSGISMLSLFLVSGHVYVYQEYRCCLCSLSVVMYIYVSGI